MENTSAREIVFKLLALAGVIAALYFFFRVVDIAEIQLHIKEAGVWAPLILIAAKASTIVIAPLTGSPLYPIAGALFGFWQGFFLLIIGDMVGGSIAFWLSRFFGRGLAERLLGSGNEGLMSKALEMMGSVRGFFLARLGFITFPEVPAYAAGLSRIPFIPFLLIYTVVGAFPTAVTTGIGAFLTQDNNSYVFTAVLILGGVVSAISILTFMNHVQKEVDKSAAGGGGAID